MLYLKKDSGKAINVCKQGLGAQTLALVEALYGCYCESASSPIWEGLCMHFLEERVRGGGGEEGTYTELHRAVGQKGELAELRVFTEG